MSWARRRSTSSASPTSTSATTTSRSRRSVRATPQSDPSAEEVVDELLTHCQRIPFRLHFHNARARGRPLAAWSLDSAGLPKRRGEMALIDLSHRIEDGMAAYPGLPPVRIITILDHDASRDRYEGRAEFLLGGAELAGNTGTYLDAPFHRFRDREDLADLPLETVVGLPGFILDADGVERAISLEGVEEGSLRGRAFVVRTGWDARWGSEE